MSRTETGAGRVLPHRRRRPDVGTDTVKGSQRVRSSGCRARRRRSFEPGGKHGEAGPRRVRSRRRPHRGGRAQDVGRRPAGGDRDRPPGRRPDGLAQGRPHPAAPQPARRLRLPRLRVARAARHVAVRVLRERRQGRRRGGHRPAGHRRRSSPSTRSPTLAGATDYWLGQQGRLTEPMHRPPGADALRPIAWDAAFARIGAALRRAGVAATAPSSTRRGARATRPRSCTSCSCGRSAPTTCPTARTCATSRAASPSGETIGIGKGTVTLDDFDAAELILVVGQNPGTNHPRMLVGAGAGQAQRRARSSRSTRCRRPGCCAFRNPQRVARRARPRHRARRPLPADHGRRRPRAVPAASTAAWSHDGGAARPGVRRRATATGSTSCAAHLDALDRRRPAWRPPASTAARSTSCTAGSPAASGSSSAGRWGSPSTARRWPPSGDRQHPAAARHASAGRAPVLCPVRGHSNVQGDRTMGIYEKPPAAFLDALDGARSASTRRAQPRLRHRRRASRRCAAGDVDVFVGLGGNFVAAAPDTDATAAALRAVRAHGAGLDQAQPLARARAAPRR